MVDNYLQLVERIASAAGLEKGEIERKVEAKRAKLSGLVSKEGAAQIVAAELGINFDKEKLKISELVQGMKRAHIVGKILEVSPVRSFTKNGRDGKVVNLLVADESSNIKVVLWDTNHISLVEKGEIKKGDVIEISNGSVRNGELHLSSFSDIKKSKEKLSEVVHERVLAEKKLEEAQAGQQLKTRAFIVGMYEPRYFEVCPECGKRAVENKCVVHGDVKPEKRALLTLVIDDGSESLRAVLFMEQLLMLGFNEEEIFSLEAFNGQKQKFLGEEFVFSGTIRANQLYGTTELMVSGVEHIQPELLIQELQKS